MKKMGLSFICNLLIGSFLLAQPANNKLPQYFFVGTYTEGGSEGIYNFSLDRVTGKLTDHGLAAKSNNPSFLALTENGKFLLAVHETKGEDGSPTGFIESFSVKKGEMALTNLGKVSSGGAHPCYVSVNQLGYVLAANYTGGSVGLLKIDENGKLSGPCDVQQHYGSGSNKARQAEPHVHSAFFEPCTNRVFTPDLGIDLVTVYEIDKKNSKLVKAKVPAIVVPPGSGPRHLVFHPMKKFVYVVNEMGSSVSVVTLNSDGGFTILETVSALPVGYEKPNTCADIHISKDGLYLYASNRGLNSIAIYSIDPKSGKITLIGQEPTRGETPRNFTLSPNDDYLLAANQNTNNIVAFRRDAKTGRLQFSDEIKAFKPVCLLFRK